MLWGLGVDAAVTPGCQCSLECRSCVTPECALRLQRAYKSLVVAVDFPSKVRRALELLGPWCDICHQVEADR